MIKRLISKTDKNKFKNIDKRRLGLECHVENALLFNDKKYINTWNKKKWVDDNVWWKS